MAIIEKLTVKTYIMKKILTIVLLIAAVQLNAQQKKAAFTFGSGILFLDTGDVPAISFENEISYKFNRYVSSSAILSYGRGDNGSYQSTSFIQGNFNVYLSPYHNNKKNNFKLGTGFSIMNVANTHYYVYDCGNIPHDQLRSKIFEKRNSTGFNIIFEDTYSVNDYFLIGLKLFIQPYTNGDINSGITLKAGIVF